MSDKAPRKSEAQYVSFDGVKLTELQAWDPGRSTVTADTTAAGDALETAGAIRETLAPTASVMVTTDGTGVALRAKLYVGKTGPLLWGPNGNTAGMPKNGVSARIDKCDPVLERDNEQMIDIEWSVIDPTYLFDERTGSVW